MRIGKRLALSCIAICAAPIQFALAGDAPVTNGLADEVRARELAFAQAMADRDLEAFIRFVSPDAVFVGGNQVLRGPDGVRAGWRGYFEGAKAPFSWRPEKVEVTGDGRLAVSAGPVLDADGKSIGSYNSAWRREADGVWRIVLDNGCPACDCDRAAKRQ